MSEPLIDAERVREIAKDCLTDEDGPETDRVLVEGVAHVYSFTPAKLDEHKAEVTAMLQNLPLGFRPIEVGGGGGWTFLNACDDANGEQWTGYHMTMESLFCLGIAMGLAQYVMPKEMWSMFPGGMPFVAVLV